MMRNRIVFAAGAACLMLAGCQHSMAAPALYPRDRNVITGEEILHSRATTAYEAIARLRTNFLTYHGPPTLARGTSISPVVYVDGQKYGELGTLHRIPAWHVSGIRLFRSGDATTIFGTGHTGGVIEVTTRRR